MAEYTEGVGAGGPVIFKDGIAMSFDAIMVDLKVMNAAMSEFCDRVEAGEVHSRRTYTKFKEILGRD